ncbi:MAG: MarP family serine protease [Carbonactinosporaceae bacterium]
MNVLDLLLLAAALSFALSGYRQGFIVGVLSFAGFLGGGIVGMLVLPQFLERFNDGPASSIVAIAVVLIAAMLGQVVATLVGGQIREYVTWEPARFLDASAGAAVSAISMLLIAWIVGSAVATASIPTLSRQVRDSQVLQEIDKVMPGDAATWFSAFTRVLDRNGFPQVFAPFAPERIRPVAPPDSEVLRSGAVRSARGSIVKVLGTAEECSRQVEGTGFVYAPHRVMTNAHVVAGVDDPVVLVGDGAEQHQGKVVLFDPDRDLAVLHVPSLGAQPLDFDRGGQANDDAIVAGFPRNGPFTAGPARIRSEINARGPDIYHRDTVTREVFSLFGTVQPGNSGGPLLASDGDVYGVIFAKSLEDPDTGYALTVDEVAAQAKRGATRTAAVSTQECA